MILEVKNDMLTGKGTENALHLELIKKDKEIERLNNIINELEKWLNEYKIQCKKYDSNSTIIVINCILDKLQELKGGENNGK